MAEEKNYRPNVAAVIVNDKGEILSCRRADKYHTWQLPQGGIDEGESTETALHRELLEEIGTNDVEILGKLSKTIRYDWPSTAYFGGFHGQEQTYFLLKLNAGAKISLDTSEPQEFDRWEWCNPTEFLERIRGFKKSAYQEAIAAIQIEFAEYFKG